MAWHDKYLSVYGKPFSEVPQQIRRQIRTNMERIQSSAPTVSVVVIAHNEEHRLTSCLWSLSDMKANYAIEIIGVDNNSTDATRQVFEELGVTVFSESRMSVGYARLCGIMNARGKYHFNIDGDTMYPQEYVNLMMTKLIRSDVACVSTFWSFYPNAEKSAFSLFCYELARDAFLGLQHFKRPELSVRGLAMAFKTEYARKVGIRCDLKRGEDGSLALGLKAYGKIVFLYDRHARPVTGYGTLGSQSLWKSFLHRAKLQLSGIGRLFHSVDHYEDAADNLIQNSNEKTDDKIG